jgi:hypothetical protein
MAPQTGQPAERQPFARWRRRGSRQVVASKTCDLGQDVAIVGHRPFQEARPGEAVDHVARRRRAAGDVGQLRQGGALAVQGHDGVGMDGCWRNENQGLQVVGLQRDAVAVPVDRPDAGAKAVEQTDRAGHLAGLRKRRRGD